MNDSLESWLSDTVGPFTLPVDVCASSDCDCSSVVGSVTAVEFDPIDAGPFVSSWVDDGEPVEMTPVSEEALPSKLLSGLLVTWLFEASELSVPESEGSSVDTGLWDVDCVSVSPDGRPLITLEAPTDAVLISDEVESEAVGGDCWLILD